MKKAIIAIITVIVAMGVGVGGYIYFHTATALDNTQTSGMHEISEKETYTRADFKFDKMKVEEDIFYSTMTSAKTETHVLCASMVNQQYLSIILPSDRTYTNLFGYDIYADDGSIEVHIKAGNKDTIKSNVEHAESLTSNIACTTSGGKYKHSIIKYMDDKYVLEASVYSNTSDWSIVRDSIIDADLQTRYSDFSDANFISTRQLRENDSTMVQSIILKYNADAETVFFEDGCIQELQIAYDIEKTKVMAKTYLYNVTNKSSYEAIVCNLIDTGAAYYELGDMAAACIPTTNNNYSIIVVGSGDEAKLNMKQIVLNYKKEK